MKTLARLLPIVFGIALGLLILLPPAFLRGLGALAYLVTGTFALVLLIGFVAMLIAANLPERIALTPVGAERVPPGLEPLAAAYRTLGFESAGPPMEVGVTPPGIMLPFVHRDARCYGTVFRTTTVPPKIAFDVFSYLEGERGGLTSSAEPAGASIPAGEGDLRQVIAGATVAELFAQHRRALLWLASHGLPARAVSAEQFAADFVSAIARQRRGFLASPLHHAAVAVWRTATRTTPHLGPLESQKIAARQLRALVSGGRG